MPAFPWDKRTSANFGEVWVSFAEFAVIDAAGVARKMSAQVDTGAIVTLLRRTTGEMLGLDVKSGRRVRLGSVGGGTIAHVHQLTLQFESIPSFQASVAIAESNDVPHLLGFLGVMEKLSIEFDPIRQETRILKPLLS